MFRIDVRNTITPLALLQMRDSMRDRPKNGSLTILCDDASFISDMCRVLRDYEFTIKTMKDHGGHLSVAMAYKQS